MIEELTGLDALTRHEKESRKLAEMLGSGITKAYVAQAPEPGLTFRTKPRLAVETAGARIGVASTVLVVDDHGAFRGTESYRVDNTTEPFLEVVLPNGAELWSVLVAGRPVKPARVAGTTGSRNVRIPLLKTAEGDPGLRGTPQVCRGHRGRVVHGRSAGPWTSR